MNCAQRLVKWQAEIAKEDWTAAKKIHDEMLANGCDDPVGVCGAPTAYVEFSNYLAAPD